MKSNLLRPLVIVPAGGLLTLAGCYLLYLGVYLAVEGLFFSTNPTDLPADVLRRLYVFALLGVYVAVARTALSDLVKATVLVGPAGMVFSTLILAFHQAPLVAGGATAGLLGLSVYLLYRDRYPGAYAYALTIGAVMAVILAWPPSGA